MLLHVARPRDFFFKPGQYASLNVPGFGLMWHPFSIGSDPEAMQLTFLIEVKASAAGKAQTWTEDLAALHDMSFLMSRYVRPAGCDSQSDAVPK